ncbi:MAG: hypothetical protein KO202_08090 [Methanobacteriaceae archaeon]|jgi:hypothetical protein|nr:hypothetical protein [Methanobacteriaceae archaeon]
MVSNNIDNIVTFKKELGRQLELDQKNVGLKTGENNILTVNLRVLEKQKDEILDYFQRFQLGEPISFDIGNTGDIKCYFKGISPVIEREDHGTKYYSIAVTLQEIKKPIPDEGDEGHSCSNCGLH